MTSDWDLLQQYARHNAEQAFAELVRRHLDLVYTAALRQVRSPQLAEEVAQSVFADLAGSVGRLKPDTLLTAWLYQVTRRTAIDVVRRESRRQSRERLALEMTDMNSTSAEWMQIEPLLDEAMHALDDTDRAAVLLRYFENKSLREVGATLGTSEDAAQKRVSRAVERLREFFSKHGVTTGASGLAVVLSANAVQAAPVGLLLTISTAAALAGTSVSTSTAIVATKAITMTALQKTLITATLAAAVGTGIYELRQASNLQNQVQTLQQQQAPLAEQVLQLTGERDEATRRLTALRDDNARLRADHTELIRLRGDLARLRREKGDTDRLLAGNAQLRQNLQTIADSKKSAELTSAQDETERLKGAGQLARALAKFAEQNQGQLPQRLSDAQTYFPPGIDLSAGSSNFEMVYLPGNLTGTPNASDTIILREKEPRTTPDGKFSKAYAFADGHAQIRYSGTNDFTAWEEKWPTIPKAQREQSVIGRSVNVGTGDPQRP